MSAAGSDAPTICCRIAYVVREFAITVALASLFLLATLHAIQYHLRLFLATAPACTPDASCTPCQRISTELATVSPLDVLEVTTICALVVFLAIAGFAAVSRIMGRDAPPVHADLEAAMSGVGNTDKKPRREQTDAPRVSEALG